jgi:DNA-directed RNA polymerase subunit beta'
VKSTVAMADEVKWQNGKPVPKQDRVKASMKGGEFGVVPFRDVEYVVRSPGQIMSLPMNLVPFLANDSQNRSTMAGRHQEQAVSLKHREAPLVQAAAGKQTFDEVFGGFTAQSSPVSGTVEKVKKDSIVIRDKDGKLRDVPIYDNYPLTEKKGMLHSEPTVKVGQKVKRGQLIADTSFTKNGVYAPGTNLKVAYLPAKGLNVEDGIVISQSAAKKLTSEHLHKKNLSTQVAEVAPVKRFTAYLPERINVTQQAKLGKDGVIKVGQTVEPGDVLVTALRENRITPDDADFGRLHKSMAKPYADSSVVWEENHRGKVVGVHKRPKGIEVHVRTEEPAIVGDKIVSRHANKGVITAILPDNQMPKTGDGKGIDVLHNPIGVPGRMNVGQILETAASKIAEKTGKPFVTQNFEETDARTRIEKELKKHGLTDKETLTDQETGRKIPGVLVGNQYTLKLHHQVEDKLSVRSRGSYDRNLAPKGGGSAGGQSIGALETYGLLAHGAVKNIRDFSTYRADRGQGGDNDELWTALQAGEALPPPRPTFAYKKFEAMLRTMGVNVEKDGNSLNLLPMTDKDILAMSSGEIKDGGLMLKWDRKQKELIPEAKGLFDPKVTGGQSGTKWGHITLRERMPNPVFEKAIVSLTGLTKPEFTKIINGKKGVTKDGEIVDPGDSRATYGPSAVGHLLGKVDPKKEIKQLEESLPTLKEGKLDKANKRLKYLKALEKAGMSPNEAYMTKYVPVLPPVMRPISVMADGKLQYETVNHLYKHLALDNQKLGMINANKYLPDEESLPLRAKVYDHLKSVSGLGGSLNKEYPGLLDVIAGESPKEGYFQKKLVKKRQDLSLRSTIVPEPSLSLDEVGIPRKAAVELYKPFVAQQLRHHFGMTPLEAKLAIKENREVVNKALEQVVEERPLLLKRDPVLHKYGIQAFKPKLMEGNAIRIHPMVTSGFNADFDGDAMSAYVPMTNEAVDEARKMMPSNMLFSPSSAKVAYTPIKEMQVGLYGLTEVGKKTGKSFKSRKELEAAVNAGTVDATDIVQVQGKETTLGRMQLLDALPESLKQRSKFEDLKYRFDKKEQSKFFNAIARADPKTYPDVIDKLKNLGNEHVYFSGMSIGLDDLKTHKDIRDPILKAAAQKTKHLDLSKPEDTAKFLKVYDRAITDLDKGTKDRALKGKTQLDRLEIAAGIKGDGYRQLTAAPVLFKDPLGNIVTVPVEKSYAEGLSTADYWASINGGRKGIVQKVQSVRVPGHISKNLTNTTMNQIVQATDCGTTRGVSVGLDDPDVIGRYTQRPIKLSDGRTLSTGTLITPETLVELRKAKVQKPVVRSPMRCSHPDGVCSKCYGLDQDGRLPDKGTNLGVIAAQSLGERNVQLSMREFHSGGVHQPGKQSLADQGIERVSQIFQMPTKLKGSAVLAKVNGTVSEVQKDPAGGWNVVVEGKRHYIPASRKLSIKLGDKVKKGVPLSSGPVNPHELLPLTNINKVQNYLADELDGIYRPEGIRRRNTELVVRSMTNLTQVRDPGSHPEFIRGDFATTAAVDHLNRTQLKGQRQIRHEPVVKGIGRMPLDMQEDWLARLNHERLKETVIEGAQRGWSSDLHGTHPVPGIVYGAEFGSGTGAAKY